MLHAIVFLCGAVLMSLEMIGSRLLAPTFGTSIYIWGSLITVVMAALTLGYYLGGRIADRRPELAVMGSIMAGSGAYIGLLPLWSAPAGLVLAQLGPRAGSLLASCGFFFVPSTLLAMISPFGVKLASRSLDRLGHSSGRLSALSSAGSILGTLATSFFLIPAFGVRSIVHLLGLFLLIPAAAVFLAARWSARDSGQPQPPTAVLLVCAAVCLLLSAAIAVSWRIAGAATDPHAGQSAVLFEKDTLYHHLRVDQVGTERHLHFDRSWQSAMDTGDPDRMVFAYTSYLHLGVVAHPNPRRALFIGLGGGSAPKRFLRDYPSLERVDAVEIDPEVARAARAFFDLRDDPRLRVIIQDGRLFVEQAAREIAAGRRPRYDLVVIDAYFADTIPYHLTTYQFLVKIREILSPDGAVAANLIGALSGQHRRLLASLNKTFSAVFPRTYLFPVGGWHGELDSYERNVILIATRTSARWTSRAWAERAAALQGCGAIQENVASYIDDLVDPSSLSWEKDALLLTDDHAPVDTLQNPLL